MAPTTLEGQTLGKYRVLEALGRGGMAQVYRAYHPSLDRYMAIKVLRSDLVEDPEFIERFRREAHAVSGLRHANIVQVFDFDAQDGLYFMVMELLEGDSLRARLNESRRRGERLPFTDIVQVTLDVLAGLAYAHGEGIVHRDIKPANILLTRRGQAVITDFGIAQIVGSTQYTASGALMGTLNYMAPEQGLKGQCDQRSDIYSLGIVLYEMLTGFTPFDADTPLAILMKHLNDPLPLPTQADPDLPAALEQVVLKALAKDPADRYQSAEEMAAALGAAAAGLSNAVRRDAPLQAVYSGEARRQIQGMAFSREDTDAGQPGAPRAAGSWLPAISSELAVFGGFALILTANMLAVMGAQLLDLDVFARGWPFEVFLAAMFLFGLGWAAGTHWLQIPGLITFGTAALLAYSTLTGRWDDWVFLWMAEVLLVGAAITLPVRIGRGAQPQQFFWARIGNAVLALTSLALAGLTIFFSLLVG